MSEPVLGAASKVLILTPAANSDKRDFDNVFRPESEKLRAAYGALCTVERIAVARVHPVTLKVEKDQAGFEAAAQDVIAKITGGTPWTHVIMLCHGWATGIQLGFRSKGHRGRDAKHWQQLVAALSLPSLEVVTLYACSAGRDPRSKKTSPGSGDDSFGDRLRDESGVAVIAHTTPGHATTNPSLIMFERSPVPVIGGIVPATFPSRQFRNAIELLKGKRIRPGKHVKPKPPKGHSRLVIASIPLCKTASELHALLSAEPG